jgi:hypothetical protein
MRIPACLAAGCIFLLLTSACTSVKRFRSASYKGEAQGLVDMGLFGTSLDRPAPESRNKSLWDLSAGAQTQLIQILDERYQGNEAFTSALNRAYLREGPQRTSDFTASDLRMVFTISRSKDYAALGRSGSHFSPADRIESLSFSLELSPASGLRFTGWNRYATEYGELEIADVSFSSSLELEGEGSGERIDGSAGGSFSRREDQVIRSRYMKLNGSLSDHRIEISEEGMRGIDLTGNVIADVSLAFDPFPERIATLVYAAGVEDAPARISGLRFTDAKVPRMEQAPERIMATLKMKYVYRHVEKGWRTFQEWDDRVAYYSGTITKQVPLFERHEYVPPFYGIGLEGPAETRVRIRIASGVEYPLEFTSYAEAGDFLDWLNTELQGEDSLSIGGYRLWFRDRPLNGGSLDEGNPLRVLPVYF